MRLFDRGKQSEPGVIANIKSVPIFPLIDACNTQEQAPDHLDDDQYILLADVRHQKMRKLIRCINTDRKLIVATRIAQCAAMIGGTATGLTAMFTEEFGHFQAETVLYEGEFTGFAAVVAGGLYGVRRLCERSERHLEAELNDLPDIL